MRILITGATGFIGSHLRRRLRERHEVFAVARHRPAGDEASGCNWIEGDLATRLNHDDMPKELEVIIHLAQSKFYKEFPDRAEDIFGVNTTSTLQLLEYGRQVGIKRFIYASTGGVYGYSEEEFVETDPVNTLNFYLASKYCAELLITNYRDIFQTLVLRLFFVYGEGQTSTMLVPRLINSIQEGRPISLQGANGLRINPVYVADVIDAFEQALITEGNHLINVAGPEVLSLREIGNIIGRELHIAPVFEVNAAQQANHLIADLAKMKAILGPPKTTFVDGIASVLHPSNVQ